MQSVEGEEFSLSSCFNGVKTAVMGCCYSLCHKDSDPQENCPSETTHLLVDPVREDAPPLRATVAQTPRKPDETSALNRILQETASNVIDVGALGPHALEPHEYQERVRAYAARLACAPPPAPPPLTAPRLLKDVSTAERNSILSRSPIQPQDRDLIMNAAKKAAAAMSEIRIDHEEDLVVPFRVP